MYLLGRSFCSHLHSTVLGVDLAIASEDEPALELLQAFGVEQHDLDGVPGDKIKVVIGGPYVFVGVTDE